MKQKPKNYQRFQDSKLAIKKLSRLQQHSDQVGATVLHAQDEKGSVLLIAGKDRYESCSYCAYGHNSSQSSPLSLLGFNGEHRQALGGLYLLGNGYRTYNPSLMRFHSPDTISPFGNGGINSYAYCLGDPINNIDPSGHISFRVLVKSIMKFRGLRHRPLPLTGTNGRVTLYGTSISRPHGQVVRVAPTVRPAIAGSPIAQAVPNTMHHLELVRPASSASAQTPRSTVSPNGLIESLDSLQHSGGRPLMIVHPSPQSRSTIPRARRYSSDSSLSAPSSRDSTPPASRSASPSRNLYQTDFVQRATDLRNSTYYSRGFDS